jgi:hypothetical protein
VDLAKLMPVAYVVGVLFIGYSVLVVLADVFNPRRRLRRIRALSSWLKINTTAF